MKTSLTFAQDLNFSGLYFASFICESPSLKAQFIVEKLSSWMPCVPYQNWAWEAKWALMELGEEGVTWKLSWTSCHLSVLMGIGEVPGWLVIRCVKLVAKQIIMGWSIIMEELSSVNPPNVRQGFFFFFQVSGPQPFGPNQGSQKTSM